MRNWKDFVHIIRRKRRLKYESLVVFPVNFEFYSYFLPKISPKLLFLSRFLLIPFPLNPQIPFIHLFPSNFLNFPKTKYSLQPFYVKSQVRELS